MSLRQPAPPGAHGPAPARGKTSRAPRSPCRRPATQNYSSQHASGRRSPSNPEGSRPSAHNRPPPPRSAPLSPSPPKPRAVQTPPHARSGPVRSGPARRRRRPAQGPFPQKPPTAWRPDRPPPRPLPSRPGPARGGPDHQPRCCTAPRRPEPGPAPQPPPIVPASPARHFRPGFLRANHGALPPSRKACPDATSALRLQPITAPLPCGTATLRLPLRCLFFFFKEGPGVLGPLSPGVSARNISIHFLHTRSSVRLFYSRLQWRASCQLGARYRTCDLCFAVPTLLDPFFLKLLPYFGRVRPSTVHLPT
ncbi:basic proline-rich protein-like [Cygnus olor]|uniref:basic proline-rich protein-like n=1 Tax=Cygnus olor TaxID=8869 RepID=UPI001ADEB2B9|nr:basic proline-rich protein-like [Cygnus olor]